MALADVLVVVLILVAVIGGAAVLVRHLVGFSQRQLATVAGHVGDARDRLQPPGPRRDAIALRTRLDAELRATRDMLSTAPQGKVFRADAAALIAELDATAGSLATELAAIEGFRDTAQQRAALAAVGPQVEQLIDTTYRARQTLLQTSAEDRAAQLSRLRAQVDHQAAALDVYRRDSDLEL